MIDGLIAQLEVLTHEQVVHHAVTGEVAVGWLIDPYSAKAALLRILLYALDEKIKLGRANVFMKLKAPVGHAGQAGDGVLLREEVDERKNFLCRVFQLVGLKIACGIDEPVKVPVIVIL